MKKFLPLFILLFCTQMSFSATDMTGHFHVDLSNRQIVDTAVQHYFSNYLDLPDRTTFELVRDVVDTVGYRHLTYEQYVRGTLVKDAKVLVHSLNGLARTMNGEVRTRTQQEALDTVPPAVSARQALHRVGRHNAPDSEAKVVWVKVLEGERYVWHLAYEIKSADMTRLEYVDVYTGEVVRHKSLVAYDDVQGTAYTMFSGIQPFICYEHSDGNYYLQDQEHNFITYDASHATHIVYDSIFRAKSDSVVNEFRLSCSLISNPSSTWDLSWHRYLRYFIITDLPAWTPTAEDTLPSLYLAIYDSSDSLLYVSDCKKNAVLPVQFLIPDGVEVNDGFMKVCVYDYKVDSVAGGNYICQLTCRCSQSYAPMPFQLANRISGVLKFEDVGLQPALDAHWGMQKTIDFYRDVLGRNGHDNRGGALYQYYNPQPDAFVFSTMPANAFAQPGVKPNMMAYGAGAIYYGDSINSMRPVVGLDVMAHEFTHLVTHHNGNGSLTYQDESGALNESFSDLMAMGAMKYITGTCDWTIGATAMAFVTNMRSLSDPHQSKDGLTPQPKYYQGEYWVTDTVDDGGVHTNSSVQNYWFYLLCEGGSGTNEAGDSYTVTGIGLEKGIQIAYLNLLYYLTPNAAYPDARWGSEQAAKELYGANSQEYRSVVAAWNAVGVEYLPELEPTAMETICEQPRVSKVLHDGQLLIIRNGRAYDALGRLLE